MTIHYLYESHMCGVYWAEEEKDYEDRYCETCGDCDYLIGTFGTAKELKSMIKNTYDKEYVKECVKDFNVEGLK